VRIVSLLPSATEIVCALGLQETLAGRSHECDFPPGVAAVPPVSVARIDGASLSSAEIDAAVRTAVEAGEELYLIDEAVLAELRPDVILTQTLCRVCAVSGDGVRSALRVRGLQSEVVELEPATVEAVLDTVLVLGDRLGAPDRAAELVAGLRARLAAVEGDVAGAPERPSVFVAEWLDPPFAAGHWVPDMVARAGGREVLGRTGAPSYPTTWEAVRAAQPEVCILAPCGLTIGEVLRDATACGVAGELAATPAGQDGRVVAVDATSMFSRPGPRLVDGVELCAALLHPGLVPAPAAGAAAMAVAAG
jgi:iron complex transport system substrate-binding protein